MRADSSDADFDAEAAPAVVAPQGAGKAPGDSTPLLEAGGAVAAGSGTFAPVTGGSVDDDAPPLRIVVLCTSFMFFGYAILVSFQHNLKSAYNIPDGTHEAHLFIVGTSFLYIFNLIFRLAHNFIFGFMKPRSRVYVAMGSMALSMLVIVVFVFELKYTGSLVWVYIAYGLGGVGVGTFESNLLSSIMPFGHKTKMWAVMGFPIGFATILIGAFMLHALGVPNDVFYYVVFVAQLVAMAVFYFLVPVAEIKDNGQTLSAFLMNLRHWREWLPSIHWYCSSLMIDMFFVAMFSGEMFYIFDADRLPMFGPNSSVIMNKNWFFVIYNTFTMIGDTGSRRLIYHITPKHPYVFLPLSLVGAAMCLSKVAILAPIGIMLIFGCNGSVYASATRHIDTHVPKRYNLTALSFWLFIGDIGSVTGSNLLPLVRGLACPHVQEYMCLGK